MGILTQTREPVQREPVTLFEDRRYAAQVLDRESNQRATARCVIPSVVHVRLDPGSFLPAAESPVYIMFDHDQRPVACVSDPHPRRLGAVIEEEVEEVLAAFRAIDPGLKGLAVEPSQDQLLLQIRIRPDAE